MLDLFYYFLLVSIRIVCLTLHLFYFSTFESLPRVYIFAACDVAKCFRLWLSTFLLPFSLIFAFAPFCCCSARLLLPSVWTWEDAALFSFFFPLFSGWMCLCFYVASVWHLTLPACLPACVCLYIFRFFHVCLFLNIHDYLHTCLLVCLYACLFASHSTCLCLYFFCTCQFVVFSAYRTAYICACLSAYPSISLPAS